MKKNNRKSFRDRGLFRFHNQIQNKRGKMSPVRHLDKFTLDNDDYSCPDCKHLGFCRLKYPERYSAFLEASPENEILKSRVISYDISQLSNLIEKDNFETRKGVFSAKNIRLANEAFHAEEYETAYTYFSLVAEENFSHEEALLGMAISLFYMDRYEESVLALNKCNEAFLPDGMKEAFSEAASLRQQLEDIAHIVKQGESISVRRYELMV